MKFLTLFMCTVMAVVIGQAYGQTNAPTTVASEPETTRVDITTLPTTVPDTDAPSTPAAVTTPRRPRPSYPATKKPCGAHDTGDYKGSCDESVPVIVMPKGRPIMERVLDWFKCSTEDCTGEEKTEEPQITGTSGPAV